VSPPPRPGREAPFPDVRAAFLLTIGALFAAALIGVLVSDLGLLAAAGIGQAIGIGGVATLAARRVPEPQAARIGLVALPWRAWPLILCLVPAVLLASELDNLAQTISPTPAPAIESSIASEARSEAFATSEAPGSEAPGAAETTGTMAETAVDDGAEGAPARDDASETDAEPLERLIDPSDPFNLMEALIVMVGIAPIVEEFLFRGVLQQGLVARLGIARGLTLSALLWTMIRPVPATSFARFVAAFVAAFTMGWLLGVVRLYSGSILGSVLLASLWAAVAFASLALEGRVELPGLNVEGTHLPVAVTIASLAIVSWAGRQIYDRARRSAVEP